MQIGIGLVLGALPGVTILALGLGDDDGGASLPGAAGTTLGVALFVVSIAALSCLGPLRRALSIEPTQVLRADQ